MGCDGRGSVGPHIDKGGIGPPPTPKSEWDIEPVNVPPTDVPSALVNVPTIVTGIAAISAILSLGYGMKNQDHSARNAPRHRNEDDSTLLRFVCSRCGCNEIFAIAPGTETERQLRMALVRGRPDKAWCSACWAKVFQRG